MATVDVTQDPLPGEEWHSCPGFENHYSISNKGRVRRDAPGKGPCVVGRILKPTLNAEGYLDVALSVPGKTKRVKVHRLVAEAFIGTPFPGAVVNHKDGNKLNNDPGNLEWVTVAENEDHATAHGLRPLGDRNGSRTHPERLRRGNNHHTRLHPERMARGDDNGSRKHPERLKRGSAHPNSKLTEEIVLDIKIRLAKGEKQRAIAAVYSINHLLVSLIKRDKIWRHVVLPS